MNTLFHPEADAVIAAKFALRDYQQEAYDAIVKMLFESQDSGVVCLPTGAGKTIVFATLIRNFLHDWPSTRICILAHRYELLTQAENKILSVWPDAPTGIYSSGLKRKEAAQPILIAGIQSIYEQAYEIDPFDLVIIDEAHLVPPKSETMFGQFLGDMKIANPNVRTIGFTATPYRLDNGLIYGKEKIFDRLIYEAKVRDLLEAGHLCPLTTKAPHSQIDTTTVKTRNGDFVESQLENEAIKVVRSAVEELVDLGRERKKWLVFACGVDHAEQISAELDKRGIRAPIVVGTTERNERSRILEQFDSGDLRVVVNVGCLTTGLDVTGIDLIACLRPTQSVSLWVQMLGRGMRLHPGKANCLILDYGGNTRRHGPIDGLLINEPSIKNGMPTEAPVKTCPECGLIVSLPTKHCPDCGHEFVGEDEPKAKHDAKADVVPLLAKEVWTEAVTAVTYHVHTKPDSAPSLCVTYRCGFHDFKEWICFGHTGYAREKACMWWRKRTGELSAPTSAAGAMDLLDMDPQYLTRITKEIRIRRDGKYHEIVGVIFRDEFLYGDNDA